ncbi:MAG TPA: TNT domain-containing protein [Actinospica sp.]|nr:TNT domain-containing protein [Actinospica sp.]
MTKPRLLLTLAAAAAVALGIAGAADASTVGAGAHAALSDTCSSTYYEGNALLGPQDLPDFGPVGFQLIGYDRTGFQSPADFLAQFRNASGWIYPPDNGYQLDGSGNPIEWRQRLFRGQDIDRYGSVYGSFLAPAGTPYAQRAIPPTSLESTPAASCNYHDYVVLKPFTVDAGPIAAWFDQPGGGLQYQLDAGLVPGAPAQLNVLWLLNNGYLAEITPQA